MSSAFDRLSAPSLTPAAARTDLATGLQHVGLLAALALVYFLAGKAGLTLAAVDNSISAIWPPSGIAIGALLVFGPRVWPAIFAGAFVVNVTITGMFLPSFAIALGNTAEAWVAALLVNRFADGVRCFDRPRSIFRFLALAALAATTLSATFGVLALTLARQVPAADFRELWLTWWLGDAVGALTLTPLMVLWLREPARGGGRHWAEAGLMAAVVAAVGLLVFTGAQSTSFPAAFLCLPPIAWAAFRFGPRAVATVIGMLLVIAWWATESGLGPFALSSADASLLLLRLYLGTVVIMMLPIAAVAHQRKAASLVAEAANRAKDASLAMLSHELRNPLQVITSATTVLREIAHSEPAALDAAAVIERQTEHLARLVNDLLDVTRSLGGLTHLVREPVDLKQAVSRCLAGLQTTGETRRRIIEVRADPVWVDADPPRLEQILRHLLANSLKYTPPGGTISVTVKREGSSAVVIVADNGIGMSTRDQERMFELFAQGAPPPESAAAGMGIGLTLVRRLVEQHGGIVEGRSEGLGRGSEFSMRLPAIPAPAVVPEPAAAKAAPSAPLRILIVEDNADARQALRTLLTMSGHDVHVAVDGPDGIEQALRTQPQLALIDVGLPRLDGYGVARELRARDPQLRLIALTGYDGEQDRIQTRLAGFDEHLVKPVTLARLLQALDGARPGPAVKRTGPRSFPPADAPAAA